MFVIFLVFSQMTNAFGYKIPSTGRLIVNKNAKLFMRMQGDDFQPIGQKELAVKKFQQQLLQVAVVTSVVIVPQTSSTWANGMIHV